MNNLLAIDPGLNHAGVAYFVDDVLQRAWTINPRDQPADASGWVIIAEQIEEAIYPRSLGLYSIAYEMPQFLPGWQKGDQNAILQVAGAAGAIVQMLSRFCVSGVFPIAVRPSEWTKGRPKMVNHLRMWNRLSELEAKNLSGSLGIEPGVLLACIRNKDEADLEHALDAVCIGLKVLDRFERET